MENEIKYERGADRSEKSESPEYPGKQLPSACPYCGMKTATPHELLVHIFRCHPS